MHPGLQDAYATCLRLARSHYENFPVASWLLPAQLRPHIAAIYAFARIADDFADEPGLRDDERLHALNEWARRLESPAGTIRSSVAGVSAADASSVFLALHDTIEHFDLPIMLFDDLLSAFRQDVTTTRYATWTEVLEYCRRSANPVGRLVLRVFGYRRDDLDAYSDALCTALQLTNFWQDFIIDWSRGRLYVPQDVWQAHGADPATLLAPPPGTAWQEALRDVSARTQRLFDEGRPVCDGVSGRLRYELRATWLGGTRILQRLERAGFDGARPALGVGDGLVIALRTVAWHRSR
jgi:phytoene synthase